MCPRDFEVDVSLVMCVEETVVLGFGPIMPEGSSVLSLSYVAAAAG